MCHHAGDLPGRSRTGPNPRARRTPGVRAGRAGPAPRRRLASSASPPASREARASGRARCPPPPAPPPAPAQVRNEREPGRLGCTLLRYNGARGREFRTLAGPTRRRGPTEILGLGPGGDASSSRPPPLTPLTERLFPESSAGSSASPPSTGATGVEICCFVRREGRRLRGGGEPAPGRACGKRAPERR